jgi:acyloxyacyl hydrolase
MNEHSIIDFYGYMECLEVSPCAGWMSADPVRRQFASDRADSLAIVLQEITKNESEKFSNFELIYMDYPLQEVKLVLG